MDKIFLQFSFRIHTYAERIRSHFSSHSDSYYSGHILCSCPSSSLLLPAMHELTDLNTLSDIQKSGSLRSIELMSACT